MAKNPIGKRKSAAKAAPKKPAAKTPVKKTAASPKSGGTFRLIAKTDLEMLMKQCMRYQNQVSDASGSMGDLIRTYADSKHLHRGAFADTKKLYRMGQKDPSKLWLHLAHFDHMRKTLGLDKIAKEQGQLLDAGLPKGSTKKKNGSEAPNKEPAAAEPVTGNVVKIGDAPRPVSETAGETPAVH